MSLSYPAFSVSLTRRRKPRRAPHFGSDLFKGDFEISNDQLDSPKKAIHLVANGLPHESRHLANAYIQGDLAFELDIGVLPVTFAETKFEKLSFVFEKVGIQLLHLHRGKRGDEVPLDAHENSRKD